MAFSFLTFNTNRYNPVGPGRYSLESVTFSDPQDYVQISGGKYNAKTGLTTAAFSHIREKDVTVGSDSERRRCTVQHVIQIPYGFTATEVDESLAAMSEFVTLNVLDRVLQGEQ